MKKKYVLGFAFSNCKKLVLLLQKKTPTWQNGLLNGVGGKIEATDKTPAIAMVREFNEEVGIETDVKDWTEYAFLYGEDFEMHVFFSILGNIEDYKQMTDEVPFTVSVHELFVSQFDGCVHNLPWLIPLALDQDWPSNALIKYEK